MTDSTTRRAFFLHTAFATAWAASATSSSMAVEGYIFQQYAQRLQKSLGSVIPEAMQMVSSAGFRNVELSPPFLVPEIRESLFSSLRAHNLKMPSVYVGGAMHQKEAALRTIALAVETSALCAPFGCRAVVNNPDPKPAEAPKTDAELDIQAEALNQMGRTLADHGLELRIHHHTPQLIDNAREWRHILHHTDPKLVLMCVDVDWAYESDFQPLPFLQEVGSRLREIHVRSAKKKVWLEDLEDSDIDYVQVANYLRQNYLTPLIVVELAYRQATVISRSLQDDLTMSRHYAEKIFKVKANV